MALRPNDILRISEPVEQMYNDCTSRLIINLARHFSTDQALATREWETKKLSELGALTEESIEIIAKSTGRAPEVIRSAITEGMGLEIAETEKVLAGAASKGYIQGTTTTWDASESVKTVLKNLTDQATNDANIVNTVMLESTRERYVAAVQAAAMDEVALIEKLQSTQTLSGLEERLGAAQRELNASTLSVATGAEARTQAVRSAVKKLADEGITGYIDRGGHHWSPDAYVNMDIRTTVHNAAIQGQRARSADYGVSTFQISSHGGARPLCAPYQGKFYSWDGSSGTVEDLYGNKYQYESIYNTSYGEPAGIFGINCGHRPNTFVSGYNVPRFEPTEDEEENAKQYELSQRQRYMERQIRQAKTEALAYDAAGDKEAFDAAALKVRERTAAYKDFCLDNGRTQRLERTQVFGYNKDVARKIVHSAKKYNHEDAATIKAVSGARITNIYGSAAEKHAKRYYGLVRSMSTDVEKIAQNTGYSAEDIKKVKDFLFIEVHDLGNGRTSRFDPDFAIAQSWQRLMSNEIETHDITLLNHEIMERQLMLDGMSQNDAHILASREYNYAEEVKAYYANIKKRDNK